MHRHRVSEPVARRARSLRLVRSPLGNSASDGQAFAAAPALPLSIGNSLSLGSHRSLASMMGRPSATPTLRASASTSMKVPHQSIAPLRHRPIKSLPRLARAARPLAGSEPMAVLATESGPVVALHVRRSLAHTCQQMLGHRWSKALPNPSIERTATGKPASAAHVKR